MAQVSIAGQPNGRANVRITDGQGQSRTAALALDPKRPDSASLSFEVVNNGQEWDGTVHYEAAQPGLRILCEYY